MSHEVLSLKGRQRVINVRTGLISEAVKSAALKPLSVWLLLILNLVSVKSDQDFF